MTSKRPQSPHAVEESNTSECDKTDAKSMDDTEYSIGDLDEDVWDLFEKVHTMHKERESVALDTGKRSRIATMGGFVVNKTTLLKLHIDEQNYITIPIRSETKAADAIQKIVTRRKIPKHTQCKLYQDGQEIDDNANLYEIMQITSGTRIQVRFKLNDTIDLDKNRDHHLIDSMIRSDDDDDDDPINNRYSPYRMPKRDKNRYKNQRRRAFPNKMNLVAFNKFSIQQSDDNDGMIIYFYVLHFTWNHPCTFFIYFLFCCYS